MIYNSFQFIFFFIVVTCWYFLLPPKYRWALLLLASCYFYMAFVPKYIFILGCIIIIDYLAGICIEKVDGHKKKIFLILSLVANIAILIVFKYYDFINENIDHVLTIFGHTTPIPYLNIILPIGLSFHTFQAMSYTIEVYRGNQKSEKHFGIYALYVMFYPQLVAGPIERPQNVLHQFHEIKKFNWDSFKSGLMQMAWGMFKKVVIADRLALAVDPIFEHPSMHNGTTVLMGILLYSFQIYCDFSGYSDIGIGAAKTMGYDLMKNFNSPYLSTTLSEFWGKWHISLSSWFRDYVYIPLGGNRVAKFRLYLNLMIVFLLSGIWHGANWTYVIWGSLHGFFLIVENKIRKGITIQSAFQKNLRILFIFLFVSLAWVFFRSPNVFHAIVILKQLFSISIYDQLNLGINRIEIAISILLIICLLYKEKKYPLFFIRSNIYFILIFCSLAFSCYLFGVFDNKQFIYFQF